MNKVLLQGKGLVKSFAPVGEKSGAVEVLRGIEIEVAANEVLAIVGASGSGKSTLLHILGGLDSATAGSVWWEGKEIGKLSEKARSKMRIGFLGFVFQFHHLLPEFTAVENVAIPCMIGGMVKEAAFAQAKKLIARVGLAARGEHKPAELSGGEQQRVAVARAMANSPKVILADEPTGNLDSASSREFLDLVKQVNKEQGVTFVLVTHNDVIASEAGRVMKMVDGGLTTKKI